LEERTRKDINPNPKRGPQYARRLGRHPITILFRRKKERPTERKGRRGGKRSEKPSLQPGGGNIILRVEEGRIFFFF